MLTGLALFGFVWEKKQGFAKNDTIFEAVDNEIGRFYWLVMSTACKVPVLHEK